MADGVAGETSIDAGGNVIVDAASSEDLFALGINAGITLGGGSGGGDNQNAGEAATRRRVPAACSCTTSTPIRVPPWARTWSSTPTAAWRSPPTARTLDDAAAGSARGVASKTSGYGASVVVVVDLDETLAFVGDGASITALGGKDVGIRNGVHDGDGNQGIESAARLRARRKLVRGPLPAGHRRGRHDRGRQDRAWACRSRWT